MADKEERIEISKYDLNNKEWNGDTHIDIQKVYTRKEVIERMAKAICRTYGEDCETCRFNGNEKGCKRYLEFRNYIAMAEAALNALLEDQK